MAAEEKKEREVTEQDVANFLELAKQLGVTIRRVSLYFYEHPLVQDSYKRLWTVLQTLFAERPELTLGYIEGKIIMENVNLTEQGGQALIFLDAPMRHLSLESLRIAKEVTGEELKAFIMLMSDPQKTAKDGGLAKLLEDKNIKNIAVNQSVFVKVKKGDTVITTAIPKDKVKLEEKDKGPKKETAPEPASKPETAAKGPGLGTGLGPGEGPRKGPGLGAGLGPGPGGEIAKFR